MESQFPDLTNHFLIAMPGLSDPHFERSVTYLCQHSAEGALGVIVNRPIELTVGDVLTQLKITLEDRRLHDHPVYFGGPVQPDRGLVLHSPECVWQSTMRIRDQLCITSSRDVLEALARGEGPRNFLLVLGYAGWSEGQLEAEMAENAWLSIEAEATVIFDHPAKDRWRASAGLVGIDIACMPAQAGHA